MRKSVDVTVPQITRMPGRPKVRSDEEQMDIIVTEATDLFLETGFIATKMDDIAAACKISKRTLYRLFPSKLELFRVMVERHRQSMMRFPSGLDTLPMEEALMQIFDADLDPQLDHRRMAFIDRTLSEAREIPELGEILHREGGERAKMLLAEWLAERKRQGAANIRDPHAAASILMDMVFGAIALKPIEAVSGTAYAERKTYLADCIRYFVNGVR